MFPTAKEIAEFERLYFNGEFKRVYFNGEFENQRYGQAFCNYFHVEDSELFYEEDINKCRTYVWMWSN